MENTEGGFRISEGGEDMVFLWKTNLCSALRARPSALTLDTREFPLRLGKAPYIFNAASAALPSRNPPSAFRYSV